MRDSLALAPLLLPCSGSPAGWLVLLEDGEVRGWVPGSQLAESPLPSAPWSAVVPDELPHSLPHSPPHSPHSQTVPHTAHSPTHAVHSPLSPSPLPWHLPPSFQPRVRISCHYHLSCPPTFPQSWGERVARAWPWQWRTGASSALRRRHGPSTKPIPPRRDGTHATRLLTRLLT